MTSPVNLGRSKPKLQCLSNLKTAMDWTNENTDGPYIPPFSFPLPLTKMAPHKRDG